MKSPYSDTIVMMAFPVPLLVPWNRYTLNEVPTAILLVMESFLLRWFSGYKKGVSSWGSASREGGQGQVSPGETCFLAYSGELVLRKTSVVLGPRVLGR